VTLRSSSLSLRHTQKRKVTARVYVPDRFTHTISSSSQLQCAVRARLEWPISLFRLMNSSPLFQSSSSVLKCHSMQSTNPNCCRLVPIVTVCYQMPPSMFSQLFCGCVLDRTGWTGGQNLCWVFFCHLSHFPSHNFFLLLLLLLFFL
jgi:hypothetical protein